MSNITPQLASLLLDRLLVSYRVDLSSSGPSQTQARAIDRPAPTVGEEARPTRTSDAFGPSERAQLETGQRQLMQVSFEEMGAIATQAIATTETIKGQLRSEIGTLLETNSVKLTGLIEVEFALGRKIRAIDNTLAGGFAQLGANLRQNLNGGRNEVDVIRDDYETAKKNVSDVQTQMDNWKASFAGVEAEMDQLEGHAVQLAMPAPVQNNLVALRANAERLGSLSQLQNNLQRQVALLTSLRDEGADISGTLDGHLASVTALYVQTSEMLERAQHTASTLIEIMTSPNPQAAARDYVEQSVAAKVRGLLHEAGLTPEAFASHLLKGARPSLADELRPRLEDLFANALPPVFSTGQI